METIRVGFTGIGFNAYEANGEVFFPLDPIYSYLTGDGAYKATGHSDPEYYAKKFKDSDQRISGIMEKQLKVFDNEECLSLVPFAIWLLFYFDFTLYERRFIQYAGIIQDLLARYPDLPGKIEAFIDNELKIDKN